MDTKEIEKDVEKEVICSRCFFCETIVIKEGEKIPLGSYECEYCKSHKDMTEEELLDRCFSIAGQTQVSDFPKVMQKLWAYVKGK